MAMDDGQIRRMRNHRHRWIFEQLRKFPDQPERVYAVERCFDCWDKFGVVMFRYSYAEFVARDAFPFEMAEGRDFNGLIYRPANKGDKARYNGLIAVDMQVDCPVEPRSV